MMKLLKKWDLSIIYKALLVVLDIVFINASSFLALWIRFNMQISEIPAEYYTSVLDLVVVNTIVTVVIFAACRLYTSLWRFASIKELVYVIEACLASVLFNILAYYLTYRTIYRGYFPLCLVSAYLPEPVFIQAGKALVPGEYSREACAQYHDYRSRRGL